MGPRTTRSPRLARCAGFRGSRPRKRCRKPAGFAATEGVWVLVRVFREEACHGGADETIGGRPGAGGWMRAGERGTRSVCFVAVLPRRAGSCLRSLPQGGRTPIRG